MVLQIIRETASDFCVKTRYWQYDFTSNLTAADPLYAVIPSDMSEMASVVWLKIVENGTDHYLTPATTEKLLQTDNNWSTTTDTLARHYFRPDEQTLRLYPIPDALIVSGFQGHLALKPLSTATKIPSRVFINHRDIISCGVKARMMEQPSKPYSNPELALYYWRKYHSEVGGVRQSVMKNLTDGSLAVSIPAAAW